MHMRKNGQRGKNERVKQWSSVGVVVIVEALLHLLL